MAILAWLLNEKMFLKVQHGTGDNLVSEGMKHYYDEDDEDDDFDDYTLWSTFRPKCINIDEELELEILDSGMLTYAEELTDDDFDQKALKGAYEYAFDRPFVAENAIVLMKDYGEETLP